MHYAYAVFVGAASLGEQANSSSANVTAGAAGTGTSPGHGNGVHPQPDGKNPVMILHDILPLAKYDIVSETGEGDSKNFVIAVSAQKVVKSDWN